MDPKNFSYASPGAVSSHAGLYAASSARPTVGPSDRQEEAPFDQGIDAISQLRDFAETLLHQLKTPLHAAEGAAIALEGEEFGDDPGERRRFARLIHRNLSRARTLVEDVRALTLTQLASTPPGRLLPFGQVLGEVLAEIQPYVEDSRSHLIVQEPVPELTVDAARLEIALYNLISNGIKYADSAKPVRWIRLRFWKAPNLDGWWVEVQDNGVGIPFNLQSKIFDPFFRGHPNVAEGSGLGLSIAREALRQLGTELSFDSQVGVGSSFRFALHARRAAELSPLVANLLPESA
jgi:signal transduction histidine kinase